MFNNRPVIGLKKEPILLLAYPVFPRRDKQALRHCAPLRRFRARARHRRIGAPLGWNDRRPQAAASRIRHGALQYAFRRHRPSAVLHNAAMKQPFTSGTKTSLRANRRGRLSILAKERKSHLDDRFIAWKRYLQRTVLSLFFNWHGNC